VEGYAWWLLLLGVGLGVALAWLAIGQMSRDGPARRAGDQRAGDRPAGDRRTEAAWISRTIGARGGIAPEPLVEEILDLHDDWVVDREADPWLSRRPLRPPSAGDAAAPAATPTEGAPRGR
jgi:hypothetical protein